MTAAARKSKPRPPDVCRLELVIRGERYAVKVILDGQGKRIRLRKPDGVEYLVSGWAGDLACTCEAARWRRGDQAGLPCKHARAVLAVRLA